MLLGGALRRNRSSGMGAFHPTGARFVTRDIGWLDRLPPAKRSAALTIPAREDRAKRINTKLFIPTVGPQTMKRYMKRKSCTSVRGAGPICPFLGLRGLKSLRRSLCPVLPFADCNLLYCFAAVLRVGVMKASGSRPAPTEAFCSTEFFRAKEIVAKSFECFPQRCYNSRALRYPLSSHCKSFAVYLLRGLPLPP